MEIRTDDELYQVNSIWLGPSGATMPFRARYIAWGIGIVAVTLFFAFVRMWWSLGFFTVAWSILGGVVITRAIGKKLTHQRPFSQVVVMFLKELKAPRRSTTTLGGAANSSKVWVTDHRPVPAPASRKKSQSETDTNEVPHA